MKIHQCDQGSELWLRLRAGIPTASEFSNLVTPKFEIRKGQMPATYLAVKLAERWLGGPLPGFGSWAIEQGHLRENEAIPWLALDRGIEVERVGFITSDGGQTGCSPDGLIGEENGLEVKCPEAKTHVGYLLAGRVPDDYLAQVQGAMFVTGRPRWTFMSYCVGFPVLLLEVERDDEAQNKRVEALSLFLTRLDSGWQRLVELNGGEEPVRKPVEELSAERPKFTFEMNQDQTDEPIGIVP